MSENQENKSIFAPYSKNRGLIVNETLEELENIRTLDEINYLKDKEQKNSVNADFVITKKRLLELQERDPDFDDENEINSPSDYALSTSENLLEQLYSILGDEFPRGFSILDSRGGVNLIWRNQEFDKEVKIKIPVNNQLESYVYYYQGDDSELKTITVNTPIDYFVNLLRWLSNNNPITSV